MIDLILLMFGAIYSNNTPQGVCYFEPDWMGNLWEWDVNGTISQNTFDGAFNYLWSKHIIYPIDPPIVGCPNMPPLYKENV